MTFDAYVTEIIFDRAGRAWFALGDGTIAGESGERVSAHDGAVLAAAAHPSGEGVVSGGDDGRLVWTRDGEAKVLAEIVLLALLAPKLYSHASSPWGAQKTARRRVSATRTISPRIRKAPRLDP